MRVYSQSCCRGDVFFSIIDKEERIRRTISGGNRMLKDFSVGFQRAHFVGKHEVIKIIHDEIPGTDVLKMRFMRVRYQNQRVIPFERRNQLKRNYPLILVSNTNEA